MTSADDTLASIDEAIDDYVTWHGSVDSASWSGDGSHEHDTTGDYYAHDALPSLSPAFPAPRHVTLIDVDYTDSELRLLTATNAMYMMALYHHRAALDPLTPAIILRDVT